MTLVEINTEVARLERESASLEQADVECRGELQRLLAMESRFQNESELSRIRRDLANLYSRSACVQEQIAALKGRMPSMDEIASAGATAANLVARAAEQDSQIEGLSKRFVGAMEETEVVARELVNARRERTVVAAQLSDLKRAFGLEVSTRDCPQPLATDVALTAHLAALFGDVSRGHEPDSTTELYLQAARAERLCAERG